MTAQLTFDDEFNGLSLWNGSSGTWDTTFWYDDGNKGSTLSGNGEQEMYVNANYAATASVKPWTVNNGVLTLQAAPASADISAALGGYKYTAGQINTFHSFTQEYGYFEMRAQLPAGQGLWPAFWLVAADGSWPPELDVMEVLGNDPGKLYTTVHTGETGTHTMSSLGTPVADTSSGYHTYGVDWEADKITFYFDGKQVYQVDTPADMHKPMYMIANLAVGGGWPGNADSTTPFPADMNIDYIRAWNANPYADGVAAAAVPAPSSGASSAASATPNQLGGTAGDDVLTGQADAANQIRGLEGNDSIVGGTQHNDINGNTGNDTIVGRSTVGDWLLGGQGQDSIDASASTGHNIINGNLGDDTIHGGAGGDTLRGGQGQDLIVGGSGADWISGDLGNNTLTGGQGADTFHGGPHGSVDYITDFNGAEGDRIQLDAGSQYHLSQQSDGLHLVFDSGPGGQIILQGVDQSNFQSGWVIGA